MRVSAHASLTSSCTSLTFTYPHPHSKDGKGKIDLGLQIFGYIWYRIEDIREYLELGMGIGLNEC